MNLPNKLTILRVLLVPVFVIVLFLPEWFGFPAEAAAWLAAIVFIGASVTDMLDGKIARKRNLITDFGKFMDPLADKFLVISAMLGILAKYDYLRAVFIWAAAVVIFRELAVTSIRLVAAQKSGMVVAASWLGKVKTVTQMTCILAILLEPVILPFPLFTQYHLLSYVTIAAMIVMTIWSGVEYFTAYGKNINMK